MQKYKQKSAVIILTLVLVSFFIFFIKSCGNNDEMEYIFEPVTRGDVKETISVTGSLDVVDPVTILSKLNGVIDNIYTDFNKNVKKGSLLVKIDSTAIEQNILKISSRLESGKLEVASAENVLAGKKNLYKDNLISKQAMQQAQNDYRSVKSRFRQIEVDYNAAVRQRKFARIYSPINGIVIALYKEKDQPVGVNTPLALLAPNLKKMLLTISIDESDIGNIRKGQQVIFSVSAFPDKKFKGVINQVRINPVKSGGLVIYQSLVMCDNSELLLKPGMTATATVVVDHKKDVLRVLNPAFIVVSGDDPETGDTKKIIWEKSGLLDGKPYKKVKVKTGLVGDMYTEIVEGIDEKKEVLIQIKEIK